jgi:hypothetical protein
LNHNCSNSDKGYFCLYVFGAGEQKANPAT